jgi:hypothetical protein
MADVGSRGVYEYYELGLEQARLDVEDALAKAVRSSRAPGVARV